MQGHEEQLLLQLASRHMGSWNFCRLKILPKHGANHRYTPVVCNKAFVFVLIDTLSFLPSWKKTSNPMSMNPSDVTIDKPVEYPPLSLEIEIPPDINPALLVANLVWQFSLAI
jgi:hypothetical protein